jgi:Phospholipase_D-nuclease N-terminal
LKSFFAGVERDDATVKEALHLSRRKASSRGQRQHIADDQKAEKNRKIFQDSHAKVGYLGTRNNMIDVYLNFLCMLRDKEFIVLNFHSVGALLLLVVVVFINVFWLWMLIDCLFNKPLRQNQKGLWVLFILLNLFTHILGALIYFIFGRPKKHQVYPPSQGAPIEQPPS